MSTQGTTNLDDLPTISSVSVAEPVQLKTTEVNVKVDNPAANLAENRENDAKNMNELISNVQKASSTGALELPQQDIPQSQEHIVQDKEIKPNYVPESNADYIGAGPTKEEILRQHERKEKDKKDTDDMLDILQVPIILSILYFAFQMPVLKKVIFDKLPFLFNKDGNSSTIGSAVTSIAFAGAYMGITYILDYLSL